MIPSSISKAREYEDGKIVKQHSGRNELNQNTLPKPDGRVAMKRKVTRSITLVDVQGNTARSR